MVGAAFRIQLPISKVSDYFEDKPEFVFYPYFFTKEGSFVDLTVQAKDDTIGSRQILIYLPPGFFLS
jgi:hypothetical protein